MNHLAAQLTLRPWLARMVMAFFLAVTILMSLSVGAHADDAGLPDENQLGGVQDSHGVPAEKYKMLPFDRGGMDNFSKLVIGVYVDLVWPGLTESLNFVMWFFKWLLSFQWVGIITVPIEGFATTIQNLFGGLNFIPFALALTGLVYGFAMAKGRYSHGAINLVTTALVASLLTGVLANPASTVLGPNSWLQQAINGGGQVAVAIATDGKNQSATGLSAQDVIDESFNQQLTDIFLREPAMYVSFGKKLTGECEAVFDAKMKAVKPGDTGDNSVRDAVAACDPAAKFFIEHPSGQLNILGGVILSIVLLLIMAAVLGIVLIATVAYLGFRVLKLIPSGYMALLPGEERGGFWQDLAAVAASLAMVAASLSVLVLYLRFVIDIMNALDGLGRNKFILLGFLYIGGAVLMFVLRKRLHQAANKAAAKMSGFMGTKGKAAASPVSGSQVIKQAKQGFRTAQSFRTANAVSRQEKRSRDGGVLPVQGRAGGGPGTARSVAADAVQRAGGAKLHKALAVASKVPGIGVAARGVQVATVLIPKAQQFANKAKEATQRVTHEPTRRTARNENLRQKLGKEEQKLGRRQEKVHTKLDALDVRKDRLPRHGSPVDDMRRAQLQAKEEQLQQRLQKHSGSDRAEKLRAKLTTGENKTNRYEERRKARRENGGTPDPVGKSA